MNLIEKLKELDANRNIDCDAEERFINALDDAWPKLVAFVQAYDEFTKDASVVDMNLYDRMYEARKALNQES